MCKISHRLGITQKKKSEVAMMMRESDYCSDNSLFQNGGSQCGLAHLVLGLRHM